MTEYREGTVLTCSHSDCDCRVRIESECRCPDAGRPYLCSCGAPMVEVTEGRPVTPAGGEDRIS